MRHRPRDLLICCGLAVILLTFAEGRSVRHAGREMPVQRISQGMRDRSSFDRCEDTEREASTRCEDS